MPGAPKVGFNDIDQSFGVESLIKGVAAVMLKTQRGKYGISDDLYTSWTQFQKQYGGEAIGFDGVTQAKRALERGAMLRVCKIGHYTTISDPTTLTPVKAVIDNTVPFAIDGADLLFNLTIKYGGLNYNNVTIQIGNASNGDVDSFNLIFTHLLEAGLTETYENIKIVGKPTIASSHFLDDVISKSMFFDVVYNNLSVAAGSVPLRPTNGTWPMINGTDGGAIVDSDYAGDSAGKTGMYSFGNYDDFEVLASLDNFNNAVHVAGSALAAQRQDFVYVASIPKSNVTVSAVNTFRATTAIDNRFVYFVTGSLKIQNPFITTPGGTPLDVSEIGDVIGMAMKSSAEFGPWYSFAEQQRGLIFNALGVVNNFGPNYSDLNALALRQVNCVVNKNGRLYLTGNASAQLASSRKSFISVVKLIIFMKKSLRGTLERYLGQPMDFRTMKEIYNEVDPFLKSLVGNDKRALIDYEWRGDQYANKDSDLKVNNRPDLDQGKYKVELYLKEVVSLNEFTINIISAASGVSFDDDLNA